MQMNHALKGKTVVVAGVGPGLGAALVRKFADEGCHVAMLARSPDYLRQLEEEMGGGSDAFAVRCDITDRGEVTDAFRAIRRRAGPVYGLIHHAGNAVWGKASELSPADFEKSWRVCAFGGFLCVREALLDMTGRKEGFIFFTGATSAVRGRGDAVAFSSAKFAVRGMAHALAADLGPIGIHVAHLIIDGFIDTPAVRERYDIEGEPALQPDAIAQSYWHLALQPASAWSFEIDLRHHREKLME